jgi:lactoylglutathione lyase
MTPAEDPGPEGEASIAFNHVGLCVRDVAKSRHFYEVALGFRYWWELDAPDEGTGRLLRIPEPIGLHAVYLIRDGLVLELLDFSRAPGPERTERVMNESGLTHLSLSVRDIPAALDRVRACGGTVLEDTDLGAAVMIRDPDGQLVELTSWQWLSTPPPRP